MLNHVLNGSALSDNDNILLDENLSGRQKFSPTNSEFSTPSTNRIRRNVNSSSHLHNSIPIKRNSLSVANDSNDDSYKHANF